MMARPAIKILVLLSSDRISTHQPAEAGHQPLLVNISDFLGLGKPMETHMAGKLAISNFAHNHVCWLFSYQLLLTKNGLRSFNHV